MKTDKTTAKVLSIMALVGAVTNNAVIFMLVQNKRCEADRAALLGEDELTKRNGRAQQKLWAIVMLFHWIGALCIDSIAGCCFWKNWLLK